MNDLSVLAINSGSSSIKFAVYRGGELLKEEKFDGITPGERAGAAKRIVDSAGGGLAGVGYRIVHGGLKYSAPVVIGPEVMAELKKISALAPDHLPDQIAAIESISALLPGVPAVACFDTAFHSTMPRRARVYGLNRGLEQEGVVRYGFHGLSYEYIVERMRSEGTLPEKLVVAHLGNGASMAAILNGESVDTSMGFTPTGGFLMSTRSGDLDPGVVLHLLREKKMTADEVAELVNKAGGLKGLSGLSPDMRELEKHSPETVEVFCYQVRKFLGAYIAVLGGLDALVFTGGIGEHSAAVRAGVCAGLERMGIAIDKEKNLANAAEISLGPVALRVMKTNEEAVIARSTLRLIGA